MGQGACRVSRSCGIVPQVYNTPGASAESPMRLLSRGAMSQVGPNLVFVSGVRMVVVRAGVGRGWMGGGKGRVGRG
jgi:hypothetical protein